MAPERIQGTSRSEYYQKADIWSLGVLLYLLITGTPPFMGVTNEELY
jgi:serine/threonine protein kinase